MKLHSVIFILAIMAATTANAAVSCRKNALGTQTCTDRTTGETIRGRIDAMGNQKFTTNTGKTIKSHRRGDGATIYTDNTGARTTCRPGVLGRTTCTTSAGQKITCHTDAMGRKICK